MASYVHAASSSSDIVFECICVLCSGFKDIFMECIGRDDREGTQCGRHNVNRVHMQFWNCEGNGTTMAGPPCPSSVCANVLMAPLGINIQ